MATKIHGLRKIDKNFMKLARVADDARILDALLQDAERLRYGIRLRAPEETGTLRRSIVAKKFSYQKIGNPAVFVAVDRNPETGAPYAHMVEYGTSKSTAYPFFRRSVRAYRKHSKTESALKKLLAEIK